MNGIHRVFIEFKDIVVVVAITIIVCSFESCICFYHYFIHLNYCTVLYLKIQYLVPGTCNTGTVRVPEVPGTGTVHAPVVYVQYIVISDCNLLYVRYVPGTRLQVQVQYVQYLYVVSVRYLCKNQSPVFF